MPRPAGGEPSDCLAIPFLDLFSLRAENRETMSHPKQPQKVPPFAKECLSALRPPLASPWPGGIRLDSLEDPIAGKMTALVERGTPRDFRDIYTLCQRGLASVARCWELWEERQRMAGEDTDLRRASLAIRTHLARIEQVRPLSQIASPAERSTAEQLRRWFTTEMLHDLPD